MMAKFQEVVTQSTVLTVGNIKARYRKTIAGFFWVVMNPFVTFLIQYLIFSQMFSFKIKDYSLFLLTGLIPWLFIVQTLDLITPALINSAGMLKCLKLNPLAVILAQLFENALVFGVTFFLLLFVVCFNAKIPLLALVLLPIPLVIILAGTFAISWFLSTINVFYRDTKFLVNLILSSLFFLTPIFYSQKLLPPNMQWVFSFNLVYCIIRPLRSLIYDFNPSCFGVDCIYAMFVICLVLVVSTLTWKKLKNELYFNL